MVRRVSSARFWCCSSRPGRLVNSRNGRACGTRRIVLAAAALLWTSLFLWTYHGPDLCVQLPETAPEFSLTQH